MLRAGLDTGCVGDRRSPTLRFNQQAAYWGGWELNPLHGDPYGRISIPVELHTPQSDDLPLAPLISVSIHAATAS